MKKSFLFRFVPKPLRLIRCERRPGSAATRENRRDGIRYAPAWVGAQVVLLPLVTADRPKSADEYYDE